MPLSEHDGPVTGGEIRDGCRRPDRVRSRLGRRQRDLVTRAAQHRRELAVADAGACGKRTAGGRHVGREQEDAGHGAHSRSRIAQPGHAQGARRCPRTLAA